jgi:hypothetical protein
MPESVWIVKPSAKFYPPYIKNGTFNISDVIEVDIHLFNKWIYEYNIRSLNANISAETWDNFLENKLTNSNW